MIKDLEMLTLADLVYERFTSEDYADPTRNSLTKIFKTHTFISSTREARWGTLSEKMKGWTLLDAFDLDAYLKTISDDPKKLGYFNRKTQREGFYAAAFQKGDEIVIAYRGTDGDNGEKDTGTSDTDPDWLQEHFTTNAKIAIGTPGEQFKMAEWYRLTV